MSDQIELRAEIPEDLVDPLEAYFCETETAHWGIMQKEIDDPYEVFGIFPDAASAAAELDRLRLSFPQLPAQFAQTVIRDADWQNAYKAYVRPWSDRSLHWIPLWEREQTRLPADAAVVYLDAGMAFGTGSHETTRLCARRLLDFHAAAGPAAPDSEVIDAGCGSGVLAFSAAALGFTKIFGFDFDPEAITVCAQNAAENPHLRSPEFAVADLQEGFAGGRQGDLILANIQTDVLLPHSDPLVRALRPGGTLALSGILSKELPDVREHYSARFDALHPGLQWTVDSRTDGEWGDLCFRLQASQQGLAFRACRGN
jgi:ribosomal protein L11 methyltransferase